MPFLRRHALFLRNPGKRLARHSHTRARRTHSRWRKLVNLSDKHRGSPRRDAARVGVPNTRARGNYDVARSQPDSMTNSERTNIARNTGLFLAIGVWSFLLLALGSFQRSEE